MTTTDSHEIHLLSRPAGEPTADNFQLIRTDLPTPAAGQVVVRNTWMSVDPYMRGRMDDGASYLPPFEVGQPLEGSALGEVVASRSDDVPVGATVVHFAGWRSHSLLDAGTVTIVDQRLASPQVWLSLFGTTGLTAWIALTQMAPVRDGDVVFVSAAAGAVGSAAGQIARKLGASRVIGSAGGPRKAQTLLDDFGFDAALDYKAAPIGDQLLQAAPAGIDVYLDSVGGDHLEAAINAINPRGRIALVGMIAQYNSESAVPGPSNLYTAAWKEVTLRGMLVNSYLDRFPEWIGQAADWLADGSLRTKETVVEGLEHAPGALLSTLRGDNVGKMLVRLAD